MQQSKNTFLQEYTKMGYETKLIIGKATNQTYNNQTWFHDMATIDLSKCGYASHICQLDHKNTDLSKIWYFYAEDGNTQITTDRYGAHFKPVPIGVVLDALKQDEENSRYRRYQWAIALLEAMIDDKEGLSVLLYGH
jgi:hypothetical protein